MNRTKSIISASQSTMTPMALIVATLLTCLTACSSDNDSPNEPQLQTPISFGASLPEATNVEAGTRAEGLETKNTEFTVWAYKNKTVSGEGTTTSPYNYDDLQNVMQEYKVQWAANTANTTTTNTNDWEYIGGTNNQTIKYWDFDATAYRFFGYALGKETADPATSIVPVIANVGTNSATLSATVDASSEAAIEAAPYISRLWFSNNNYNSSNKYAEVVQLEFIKPFARVRIMFTYAEGAQILHSSLTDINFKPTDMSKHIPQKGAVTATYPLTGTETAETITATPTDYLAAITEDYWEGDAAHLIWYTVLPAEQDTYILSVKVDGEVRTAYVPGEFMDWKAGYEYTYIFKVFGGGSIVFDEVQVGIKGWNNAETFNHPVYNW